jgi:hypothetical protein
MTLNPMVRAMCQATTVDGERIASATGSARTLRVAAEAAESAAALSSTAAQLLSACARVWRKAEATSVDSVQFDVLRSIARRAEQSAEAASVDAEDASRRVEAAMGTVYVPCIMPMVERAIAATKERRHGEAARTFRAIAVAFREAADACR